MRHGDQYTHFKGNEYRFDCIALSVAEKPTGIFLDEYVPVRQVKHHESVEMVDIYRIGGTLYIDLDLPHVLYQDGADICWAREVDDFFGYAVKEEGLVKRFVKKEE